MSKLRRIAQNPDDLYGDAVIAEIQIKVRRNGAMSTGGDIHNLEYALAMLDNARDAVLRFHSRMAADSHVMVPAQDVDLPERKIILPV